MRLHDSLADILATKARVAVLRVLVRFPLKEFSGRELARHSRVSLAQAQSALDSLRRVGIVERRSVGRTHQWRIVEDNALWAHFVVCSAPNNRCSQTLSVMYANHWPVFRFGGFAFSDLWPRLAKEWVAMWTFISRLVTMSTFAGSEGCFRL
jgi:DNA-binding transcriptional ArsR family regulator